MPLLLAERVRKEPTCIGTPGDVRVSKARERGRIDVQPFDGRCERSPSLLGIEVTRQLEHCGIVQRGLAMQVSAGSEDEKRTTDRRVQLVGGDRDVLPRDEGEDDEIDVVSRPAARLRSSRA